MGEEVRRRCYSEQGDERPDFKVKLRICHVQVPGGGEM